MDVAVPMKSAVSIEPPSTSLLHTFGANTSEGLFLHDSDTDQDSTDTSLWDQPSKQPKPDRFLKFSDISVVGEIPSRNASPSGDPLIGSTPYNHLNVRLSDLSLISPNLDSIDLAVAH